MNGGDASDLVSSLPQTHSPVFRIFKPSNYFKMKKLKTSVDGSLNRLLQTLSEWATPKQSSSVMELLPSLRAYNDPEWHGLVTFDDDEYTRKVLFPRLQMPNQKAEAALFGFGPGQGTIIHGHPRGCLLKVLWGEIEEFRYCPQSGKELTRITHHAGSITYVDDRVGFHRVINNSSECAVTLHLYDKPLTAIQTADEYTVVEGKEIFKRRRINSNH